MKGSAQAATYKDEDLYHPEHGRCVSTGREAAKLEKRGPEVGSTVLLTMMDARYVLQTSPGLGEMELVAFEQVKYDKRDHTMKTPDPARPVGAHRGGRGDGPPHAQE
jgi:hypothetical protein